MAHQTTPSNSTQSTLSTPQISQRDLDTRQSREDVSVATSTVHRSDSKSLGYVSKRNRRASYKRTIAHIQTHLRGPSKLYSMCIHNPVIETLSTFLAATLFRATPLLWGAMIGTVWGLTTYSMAKTLGYTLSGSEIPLGFAIGWLLGVVYDYLRLLVGGK